MGLPIVREGTYDSVAQSLCEYATDSEFLFSFLDHLSEKNPVVLALIFTCIQDLKDKEYLHTLYGLCVLYRLLESEAEIQEFEAEVK